MKGLLLRDFYNAKQIWKSLIGIGVFCVVFTFVLKSSIYTLMMTMILGINVISSAIAIDEKGGWSYLLAAPVGRKQIVLEKYLYCFLVQALLMLAGIVIGVLANYLYYTPWEEFWLLAAVYFAYYLYVVALMLPLNFKIGVDKSRYLLMVIFVAPALVFVGAVSVLGKEGGLSGISTDSIMRVVPILLVAAVVLFLLSYFVSKRIFLKKEIS